MVSFDEVTMNHTRNPFRSGAFGHNSNLFQSPGARAFRVGDGGLLGAKRCGENSTPTHLLGDLSAAYFPLFLTADLDRILR